MADRTRVDRLVSYLLGLAAAGVVSSPVAQAEEDAPDLDFLAYLGSWQESDEEWLAVAEWEGAEEVREETRVAAQRKDDEDDI
ncbi:MAG TPA: hypothetical protein VIV14_11270 [Gammaproteobacteria bacterium]